MRPVSGLSTARSKDTACLGLAAAYLALMCTPASAASTISDQIDAWIVGGAIALAAGAALWAAALASVVRTLRRHLQRTSATVRASVAARDALLLAARDSVVIWNGAENPSWGYGA